MKKLLLFAVAVLSSAFSIGQTVLIDPAGDGGFETGSTFALNNWTLVNGTLTNKWELGTAAPGYSGNRAAYISTDGGTTWAYNNGSSSVVHFYKDISFPAGESDIQLTFNVQGMGEYSYDNLKIWLVATTTTPVAGTEVTGTAVGLTYYSYLGGGFVRSGALIPAANAGTTQRIIFSWKNDASLGTTPPIAIDNIKLTSLTPAALTGTYTIDNTTATGGTNFNNFVDAILRLNSDGISAGVTFNVSAGQVFPSLNPVITATGTVSNPIIFQRNGAGVNPVIKMAGSYSTLLPSGIALNGGDYFTFDGIDVLINDATITYYHYGYYIYNASATNGAQNNTIKNTKITLNRANTSCRGIYQNVATTPTAATGANSGNKYYNLSIENVYAGIYLLGNAAYPDDACEIGTTGGGITTIGGSAANDIGNGSAATWGIQVTSQKNISIFKTEIRNITGTSTSAVDGIYMVNTGSTTTSVGTCNIYNNKIHDLKSTSTSSTSHRVNGIRVNLTGATGSISNVYNNFIYGLETSSTNTTARQVLGIYVQDAGSGTAAVHNISFNNVRIAPAGLSCSNTCFEIGTTSGPVMNVKDNIFANFTGTQTGSAKHYTWVSTSATLTGAAGSVSNYNDLYVSNATNGFVGLGNTTDYATLGNWQTAMTGQDGNSLSVDPAFVTATDLHVNNTALYQVGTPIAGITTDIDGDTRNATPCIGADEFTVSPISLSSINYNQPVTSNIYAGSVNNVILRLDFVVTGNSGTLPLNSIVVSSLNTSDLDIATNGVKLYRTSSTVFDNSNPLGTATSFSGGTASFTGLSYNLPGNTTTYVWVTYDMVANPTPDDIANAKILANNINVNGVTYPAADQTPGSGRTIVGPMSGTYTIDAGGSGARNFTTFISAVTDLNNRGISGSVTFDVAADQTFAGPVNITATGTSSYSIVFQKSGTGANPVIEYAGTTGSSDAIVTLTGADYLTFNGIDLRPTSGSTAVEYGYYFYAATATNGCQNNTVKNSTVTLNKTNTSSRAVYSYSIASGAAGTNSDNKFYNNTVQNAYNAYYFNGSSSALDNNNEVGILPGGTSTITDIGGSSSTVYIISIGYQAGLKIFNTTIRSNATNTSSVYGIYSSLGANNLEIYNNELKDLVSAGSSSYSPVYGIYVTSSGRSSIYGNSIHNLNNTDPYGYSTYGIYISGGTPNNIYNNNIYAIYYSGTYTYAAYGIYIGGGTETNIYNNFISDVKAVGSTSTTPAAGIYLSSGTTINVFYNSVYLDYVSTSTGNLSAALYASTSPTAIDLRDNVFVNKTTPGSGAASKAVAFYRSSTGFTNIAAATNNNLYFAGTPGAKNLIFFDGTNSDQTLAAYKARIATKDQLCVTENPPFINVATTPYDIHLSTSVATQCESGGIQVTLPFAITTDFDGDARNNPPDIGADEFNGILLDPNPPVIAYTPLGNTGYQTNRTLRTTISDVSGVPQSGDGLPMLYWKVNAIGSWTSVQGSWVSGNIYDFSFGEGSYTIGDSIYYYIVARDIVSPTPNIGAYPSAGAGGFSPTDPPSCSTPPTTPSSYKILGTICGTINVGASESAPYNTITNAIADLNSKELICAVTFLLTDATYPTETFPIVINANVGSSPVNTVTIKPADGVTTTITGVSASGPIFRILNKYTTIDGSNGSKIARSMTIENTSATAPNVVVIASTGTTPITNVTLKNCNIINGTTGSTAILIWDVTGVAGYSNNITIQNNSVQKAYNGIYNLGVATAGNGSGLLITGNDLTGSGANTIQMMGIYVAGADGATVSNNTISNMTSSGAVLVRAIMIGTGTNNATVSGNVISNLSSTSTSTSAAVCGIRVDPGTTAASVNITGNTISGMTNTGGFLGFAGILTFSPNTNITNNTVSNLTQNGAYAFWGIAQSGAVNSNLSGNVITGLTTATTGTIYALNLQGASTGVNMFNNKVSNIKNTNTGGYGCNGISLGSSSTTANIKVYNNFVWDVAAYGKTGSLVSDNGNGMYVYLGGGYSIFFNSIWMNTNQTVAGYPAAINITGPTTAASIDIRNNIFSNTQTVGTERYAIYSGVANTIYSDINYNDYYTTGPNIGYLGSGMANLAAWQTATGKDANSISGDPLFVSSTDLHITSASISPVYNTGTSIASVTTDIDGDTRLNPPDIGADEFTLVTCSGAVGGTATGTAEYCGPQTSPPITASGYSTGIGSAYQWQIESTEEPGTWDIVPGQTNPTALITGLITNTSNYRLKVTCNAGTPEYSNTVTITIKPKPTAGAASNSPVCAGSTLNLDGTTDGVSYTWTGPNSFTSNQMDPSISAVTAAAAGTYTFTATALNGCTASATTTVVVSPTPVITSVTATPEKVCNPGTSQLQVNVAPIPIPSAANNYSFVASTGLFTALSGGTPVAAIQADDIISGALPIGFTFKYCGTDYTNVYASSNGFLSFNSAATSTATNNLTSPAAAILPLIAPLWDDLHGATTGTASYLTTGSSPNRVFTFEWLNWRWDYSATAAVISFQVKLYESSGKIEFVYRQEAAPYNDNGYTYGASIGLAGLASGAFLSLDNTSASPTASSTTETSNIKIKPATNQVYAFNPPTAPLTYQWAPTAGLNNATIYNPVASNITSTTTYNVTVTYGTCSATGSKTVSIGGPLSATANATPSTPFCAGTQVTLNATPVEGGGPYAYLWSNGSTLQSFNDTPLTSTTYDVTITDACSGSATASASVVVKPVPSVSASSNSPRCSGTTLNLYGDPGIGTIFSWTGPNSFTSSLEDPEITSVTQAAAGQYSFTATLNGCTSTAATTSVTVNKTPSALTITPPAPLVPFGGIQQLDVSGGGTSGTSILAENFNGAAAGWVITNGGSSPALANWHYEAVPFTLAGPSSSFTGFTTIDGGKFALAYADLGGSGTTTNTILTSPVFSTGGFTSATLTFEHNYNYFSADQVVAVEISTNGGSSWVVLKDYFALAIDQGTTTSGSQNTVSASIDMGAYLNQANLKIRFNYASAWGYWWLIDNVQVNGTPIPINYTWDPVVDLWLDAGATTTAYNGEAAATVYTKPTADRIYTATATGQGGCTSTKTVQVTSLCAVAPLHEDFETEFFQPLCWGNYAVSGTDVWLNETTASGYGIGTKSAKADFWYQAEGSTYELRSRPFSIAGLTTPKLHFDHAYAAFDTYETTEAMDIYYSTDQGNNWTLLLHMTGGATGTLNTAGGDGTVGEAFIPSASQWGSKDLALPAGTNMVKFRAICGGAENNLYLDNVMVIDVPVVITNAADGITTTGATLHGSVDANYGSTVVTFEYGETTEYGSSVNAVPGTVTGDGATAVSAVLTTLSGGTEYHFRAKGVNASGTVYGSDQTFTTEASTPVTLNVSNTSNQTTFICFGAQQIIYVAGSPLTFTVVGPDGNAEFSAGQRIFIQTGTHVFSGGKMLAHIVPGGPWCPPAKITQVTAAAEENVPVMERANFTLYPNPTNGNFILVQKGDRSFGTVKVEVYGMSGEKVMTERMIGEKKHEFGFADVPPGLYFVKVVADDYVETIKLVKTR